MSQARPERADAVRNRRAILAATEELLATHRPQDISIEQVALAAGVGKGTVFHRFGSRMGLMTALMVERAQALTEAVTTGPPPLGPGAPDRERLLAFLDAVIEVVARNKSLLTELAFSGETEPAAPGKHGHRDDHPVYRFWHGHISALIAAQRPDVDAAVDLANQARYLSEGGTGPCAGCTPVKSHDEPVHEPVEDHPVP